MEYIEKLALDINTYGSMTTDEKADYVAVDTYRWAKLGVGVCGSFFLIASMFTVK